MRSDAERGTRAVGKEVVSQPPDIVKKDEAPIGEAASAWGLKSIG